MVLSRADGAENVAFCGVEVPECLPFFDNCIFDGRDTLTAPPCFQHGCCLRVSAGNSLGPLPDRGRSLAMSSVEIEVWVLMGVAVMYLSLMRYSYACEDGSRFPHRDWCGDLEPRA
jgi:hypothetical protein